jgi:3D (Asp-Asp-Asp) domain-containing protein
VTFMGVLPTAYCDHAHRTATGTRVGHGTAAVDPKVIPFGRAFWVPGYGRAVALDTGGLIKGRRIDVWIQDCRNAMTWGVRHLIIRIGDS